MKNQNILWVIFIIAGVILLFNSLLRVVEGSKDIHFIIQLVGGLVTAGAGVYRLVVKPTK